MEKKIKKYIRSFFEGLLIQITSLDVLVENNTFYYIKIKSEDYELLIWKDWSSFESLHIILVNCINNLSNEKVKLKLEINGYHKSYEERLFIKVDKIIEKLKNIWWEYKLWPLNSYDRKKIHSYISRKYSNITSKSKWYEKNRRIFLSIKELKPKKLTIDIDGNNI